MICSSWSFAITIKVKQLKLVYFDDDKEPAGAGSIYLHTFYADTCVHTVYVGAF